MKLNNKGFMLAEIIIVSAIIITTIVGLYKGFSNTYTAYETRNSYYDAKTTYALKNFEDFLIDEMILNNINQEYITFSKNYGSTEYQKKFMEEYFTTYSIAELYLVKYTENNLKPEGTLKNVLDDDFKNYIKFYLNQLDDSKYDSYDYIILAKTNEDKYSALRIAKLENNSVLPNESPQTPTPQVTNCDETILIKYNCSTYNSCSLSSDNKVLYIKANTDITFNYDNTNICDNKAKINIILVGGGYNGIKNGGAGGDGGKILQNNNYQIENKTYTTSIGTSNGGDSTINLNPNLLLSSTDGTSITANTCTNNNCTGNEVKYNNVSYGSYGKPGKQGIQNKNQYGANVCTSGLHGTNGEANTGNGGQGGPSGYTITYNNGINNVSQQCTGGTGGTGGTGIILLYNEKEWRNS